MIGWASDLVKCEPDFKKTVDLLLANVILVKTLDEALSLSARIEPGFHLVTLQGEVIKTEGSLSGGSPAEISLLGREYEIQRLEQQVSQLTHRLNQVEIKKKETEKEGEKLQKTLSYISVETDEFA